MATNQIDYVKLENYKNKLGLKDADLVKRIETDFDEARKALQDAENRIMETIKIAVPIMAATAGLTGVTSFVAPQSIGEEIAVAVAVLAPLVFVLIYALILHMTYFKMQYLYHCRIFEGLLYVAYNGKRNFLIFDPKHPWNFYSFRHGYGPFWLLYITYFVVSLIFLAVTVYLSLLIISVYPDKTIFALGYLVFLLILLAFLIISFHGVVWEFPNLFRTRYKEIIGLQGDSVLDEFGPKQST